MQKITLYRKQRWLTLYSTEYDINEEKIICDVFPN